jgi:hypothetical protein
MRTTARGRVEGLLLTQVFKLLDFDSSFHLRQSSGAVQRMPGRRIGTDVAHGTEILAPIFPVRKNRSLNVVVDPCRC